MKANTCTNNASAMLRFVLGFCLSSSMAFVPNLPRQQQLIHTKVQRTKYSPPYSSYTILREGPTDSEDKDGITEKIRWIFDDGDFQEADDGDDWGFDDLFLTDDEDDDNLDMGAFMMDDSDEDEPGATLNEDDLMELHDMYPDPLPPSTASSLVTENRGNSFPESVAAKLVPNEEMMETKTTSANASATVVPLNNILASLESDLSYFYLRDELGISEDVMWKITNEAPSVLGLKAKNVRNKVRVLQSLVGFTDSEIRQLITSQPTLLQLSAKKNLSPTILYWIRQLEMGKNELKKLILGCPSILKYSRANIHRKLVFFRKTMGYSLSECRKILTKDPRLLTCSVKTGLIPRLNFLHKELDISLADIRKIAQKNPRIMRMSVEQNLTPKCIFYFIMTLQLQNKDVAKMLLKYPQILDYNLENHILPIHHYLLSLEFSTYEFSRILLRYPRLITYSLMRMKRRIGYLRYELSLEANAIRRILYQCPQIVSLGQENLEKTIEFLLQAVAPGASFSNPSADGYINAGDPSDSNLSMDDISDTEDMIDADDRDALNIVQILVTGLPTLLALSIENNLEPKVDYLRAQLGQEELANALLRMPALLGYSLDKRIRPRMEKLLEGGLPAGKITVAITLREDLFHAWLERQTEREERKEEVRKSPSTSPTPSTTIPSSAIPTTRRSKERKADSPLLLKSAPVVISAIGKNPKKDKFDQESDGSAESKEGDDEESATKRMEGNQRVVEEGGKIIHWRRTRQ